MTHRVFVGRGGVKIAATDIGDGPPVILLHGGGQTRGSWRRTAAGLVDRGYRAVTLDARGHGESDWSPEGYDFEVFVGDLLAIVDAVGGQPALIGASLGGMTSLLAIGEAEASIASALVLVDIATRIDPAGANAIRSFMTANPDGFATVEEAADAVSRYMTARPRPSDVSGLRRNLRERNGRFYWHWDPALFADRNHDMAPVTTRMEDAALNVSVPTLMVRGELSEIVSDAAVERLTELIPGVEVAEVAGAGHMVAGDANTPFGNAVIGFLERVYPAGQPARVA